MKLLVRRGRWREEVFCNQGLYGKRVGLVGFGVVAQHLAKLLQAFGSTVSAFDPLLPRQKLEAAGVSSTDLDTLFQASDIVSLHLPKTTATTGLIGADLLSRLRDGALLVNTSRGEVVDEESLTRELTSGRISGALDVFHGEVMAADNPLRDLPNVLPIPHMAGPTIDMRERAALELIDDIRRFRDGQPLRYSIGADRAQGMTK